MSSLAQSGEEFDPMPLALTGAIALPPGDSPIPWIVVLHGRHAGCHFQPEAISQWPCDSEPRFDLGFAYLAQSLAETGYGVLIPNLNAAFSETYGATSDTRSEFADQRSGQIIDAHLTRLAQAHRDDNSSFGISLTGRVDLTRLAMVGHSMGGGAAALSAVQRLSEGSAAALQSRIVSGLGPIAALVLISPTRSYPIAERADAYQLPDVPTAVIAGGCDRDIFDLSSLYYVETARQQTRTMPVAGILLPGANHNYFNAAVAEDDYYRQPDNGPLCNPQRSRDRLSRVAQETFLSQYTQAFLRTVWSTPAESDLAEIGMAPSRAAPRELFGQSVLSALVSPNTQRYTVFDAENAPATILTAGLKATFCEALPDCQHPSRPYPHFPTLLTLGWEAVTESLQVPLEGVNVSDFTSLELRLAPAPSWPIPQGQPVLAVVLRDRQGGAARVEILSTVPALRRFEADPTHGNTAPLYPSALRIPLGQFAGVDLTALTSVELVFDQVPQGKLHLASIEFVGQN
jgi:dienelactone hydrolase